MRAALVVAVVAFAGCVSVKTTTRANADLGRYRTFAFYEPPMKTRAQETFERSAAGGLVRDRIAQALARRGIRESPTPDFLVNYFTETRQKVDISGWSYPRLYWGVPYAQDTDVYDEGTLVVDFIDPPTGDIFWRGTARALIERPAAPDMNKLTRAIDRIMSRYPTQTATRGGRTM